MSRLRGERARLAAAGNRFHRSTHGEHRLHVSVGADPEWGPRFTRRRMMRRRFRDRAEAGQVLAAALAGYAARPDVLVLALPRGVVPVGYEVARALCAPLDVFLVRKLGVPGHEELAMGAFATGGVRVLNDDVVGTLRIPGHVIDRVAARERQSWRGADAPTAATARRWTCAAVPRSWWMTGSPRAPPCARPLWPCGGRNQTASSWPGLTLPPRSATSSGQR